MTIVLGIQIFTSLVDGFIRSKSLKTSLGYAILFRFTETLKSSIAFSSPLKRQKNIILSFVRMSRLADDALEDSLVSNEELASMLLGNYLNKNPNKTKTLIYESISSLREQALNSSCYNSFSADISRSWKTNDLRMVNPENSNISYDQVVLITRDSGGFFFTALTHLLASEELSADLKKVIYLCGGWFQTLDDYRDRKKDTHRAITTLFTINQNKLPMRLLNEQSKIYGKEIQSILDPQHSLIVFMKKLTRLTRLLDFTKNFLDW
ncbi:MAG: hypothetical protein AAB594_00455 [Patescibacteria group bacterium]